MKRHHFVLIAAAMTFLLGVHDGKLALWNENDPEPIRIFPYSVLLFPKQDQDALNHGIKVEESRLAEILEDFCS